MSNVIELDSIRREIRITETSSGAYKLYSTGLTTEHVLTLLELVKADIINALHDVLIETE